MTEQEAIEIAAAYVREKGDELTPEVSASRRKRFLRRSLFWHIVSNLPRIGGNWFIRVDDSTRKVLSASFTKR
jgi:hypothetical protein